MTIPPFSMIVAAAANRGIGKGGKIPWRIPEDVRYFKNITCLFRDLYTLNRFVTNLNNLNRIKRQKIESDLEFNKPVNVTDNFPIKITDNIPQNVVVMGRNTWESIPDKFRPMPDRINVVLTRNKEYSKNLPKDVQCYNSLNDCLENLSKQEHGSIFLIGGGQIYNEGIKHPCCKNLFITKVYGKYDCDTFFPEIPNNIFKLNDDDTITKIFANSMKNCNWVKGIQTNKKSGVNFEFQIFTRSYQPLNEVESPKETESIRETESSKETESPKETESNETEYLKETELSESDSLTIEIDSLKESESSETESSPDRKSVV